MIQLKWYKGTGNKKYKVEIYKNHKKIKTVQFGSKSHEHYQDKTPLKLYSNLNHLDNKRRKNYRARHGAIKTKSGKLAKDVKYSPAWFSWHYLW